MNVLKMMDHSSADELVNLALQWHEAGDLAQAESAYRRVLAAIPEHIDALLGLAEVALASGRGMLALELIGKTIKINPRDADFHGALGLALAKQGQWREATAAFQAAVELRPDEFQWLFSLAQALWKIGSAESTRMFLLAAEVTRQDPDAQRQVGLALQQAGRSREAVGILAHVLAAHPDDVEALHARGMALVKLAEFENAADTFGRVIELRPKDPVGYNNLAAALGAIGRTDQVIQTLRRALELQPDYASGHHNLGNALKDCGEIEEAIACYDRAACLDPTYAPTESNRLYALHFHPGYDAAALYREHASWGRQQAKFLSGRVTEHSNDRSPDRRLRIGYISPDFREHVVGWNLRPLFRCHDHAQFEVCCYADVSSADTLTDLLRGGADLWRDISGMNDEQAAEMIAADRIDILVDLSLHTNGNRLGVFARKPAAVQVSYLGYCGTTGLEAIDYRLSDPYLDPPNSGPKCYSEETIRLPRTYWCYEPGGPTPEVSPLPAAHRGYITFACLNNFAKVSDRAMSLWGCIMQLTPRSRLLLHGPTGSSASGVHRRLQRAGIPLDRVRIIPRQRFAEYIATYHEIDLSLDPFPFAGGITTCDNLWMGVPVVSLRGDTAVGRAGASILENVGLRSLVAQDEEEYVRIARELVTDPTRLAELRASLRGRMQRSPLMDAAAFAADVEAAYRMMWKRWCGRAPNQTDRTAASG